MEKKPLELVSKPVYVNQEELYKSFLEHACTLLPQEQKLTKTEIDVLTAFWLFNKEDEKSIRFTSPIKKLIREKFGFKHHANLENYLNSLKEKQFITKNKFGLYVINPFFDISPKIEKLLIKYEYRLQEDSGQA
jgi:hypothetical protein